MKEKSELAMYFVTRSRTISLHIPLDTIDDTVFKLACFQHKNHCELCKAPSTSLAYTYIDLFHVLLGTEGGPAVQSITISIFVGSLFSAMRVFFN
jgi:hypothetical protein